MSGITVTLPLEEYEELRKFQSVISRVVPCQVQQAESSAYILWSLINKNKVRVGVIDADFIKLFKEYDILIVKKDGIAAREA